MEIRTDDQARDEFIKLLDDLGGTKAEAIIMREVGFKVSRSTFYRVKDGNCKPTLLHLLTYALRNAVQNKDNAHFLQAAGRAKRNKEATDI
ncbi:hypothetical protein BTZ53_10815 [Vibrio parahaemolyticus]|uniref:hypothetical protein n=1 Tax=Vibrio parahaemolyticus TaxID=670 RepID=UPI000A36778D|nr:hypothetical protein [Vibrio parahaemolyticus]OUJ46301.1 hypothetical protein BTZ53_10815 [Vibrio parahaemolyticus]HDF8527448.1 hypothetical protein [Vibrio parahaemolyticus]